jgi:hypothetical protein
MKKCLAFLAATGLILFANAYYVYADWAPPEWRGEANWSYSRWTNWNWERDAINNRWDCLVDDYQETIVTPDNTGSVIWSELPGGWDPVNTDHYEQDDQYGSTHKYFMKDFGGLPNPDFGKLKIHIDNSNQPNPQKRIRVQIASNKRYEHWGEIKIFDGLGEITGIDFSYYESYFLDLAQ